MPHQERAIAAHQRGGEALVFRYGAIEFAEVSRAGGDDDDPVESLIRRRAAHANVEFWDVGQRPGLLVSDKDADILLLLGGKAIAIGDVNRRDRGRATTDPRMPGGI